MSEMAAIADDKRTVGRLLFLFATLYFIQGVSEPSEGLIAQPTRSLLRHWGYDAAFVSTFMGTLVLPWSIKPLYGLFTDFVPLFGTRRRSWLLLTSLVSAVGLVAIYAYTPPEDATWLLLAMLLVPTVGVAFSDVVIDALMVQEGQPRGITGRLQGVQWTAIYGATILTGMLGGLLSQRGWQKLGYLIAGLVMLLTFTIVLAMVREPHRVVAVQTQSERREGVKNALRLLVTGVGQPGILAIGAFIFMWNFNPFSTSVLYMHTVEHMGFSEQFAGNMVSMQAFAAMAAAALYAGYSRRLTVRQLVWLSIVMGVLATISYWGLSSQRSAVAISLVVGFVYMTGMIVQLDLAARVCDTKTAGTTFALLMSLSNLAVGLSAALGGHLYEWIAAGTDYTFAFRMLVGIGALFTSGCALLVPVIERYCAPRA